MSGNPKASRPFSFSRDGFQPLHQTYTNTMPSHDATTDIPLQSVVTHSPTGARRTESGSSTIAENEQVAFADETTMHKEQGSGMFHRRAHGRRKLMKVNSKGQPVGMPGYDAEEDVLNRMGKIYRKIVNFSTLTRYFIYVLPLALCIAVPIVVGATAAKKASLGGVRIVWLFTWVEIVWLSLWVSKIVAHYLPAAFMFLAGVVSSGTRKYALVIRALEIPLSLVGWALVSLATFIPLMTRNPDTRAAAAAQAAAKQPVTANAIKPWQSVLQQILAAAMFASLVLFAEKLIIQLLSINYHRKQFNGKIKENKRNVYLLSLLYDASRAMFPMYCNEFAEEDFIINDSLNLSALGSKNRSKNHSKRMSGSATPMRLIQDVGRFGDQITSVFGNAASEITGKQVFNPNSAHSVVVEALERRRSSEALAKRLWMSFVVEGRDALYQEDILEVLGPDRQIEAEECFAALDKDGNGDVSLDEMILTVTEYGRDRKSIANSMHDVDQAIKILDRLLCTVVFIICVFIFVAFLNRSFTTTLATAGTALLSMSFVFAATCQEVLGSCIFLFVKHPYDIGDRIDINTDQFTVEHISLLFTIFKRVSTGKTVQIPNIVLNTLWIENVSRSKAMREQITMYINFDTSFEDIKALKDEMQDFVLDKENSRDFQPDIEVEVTGIAEMNKLELRVEIKHKSNWANETVRASRRSKFMCALVSALRKVPIYGPGAGGAALGEQGKPSYTVAISPEDAQRQMDEFAAQKEAKRLFPSKKPDPPQKEEESTGTTTATELFGNTGLENNAANALNARAAGADFARDDQWASRDDNSTLGRRSSEQPELEEVRGLLHRQSTRGKRRPVGADRVTASVQPTISEVGQFSGGPGPAYQDYGRQQQQQRGGPVGQQLQQQQQTPRPTNSRSTAFPVKPQGQQGWTP